MLERRIHYDGARLRCTVIPIDSWRPVRIDQQGLRFRPAWRTVLQRLPATILFAIVFAGLLAAYRQVDTFHVTGATNPIALPESVAESAAEMEGRLREMMTDGEWEVYLQERDAKRVERERTRSESQARIDSIGRVLQSVMLGGIGIAAALAVITPLSCLWNSVTAWRTRRNEFVVRFWGAFRAKTRSWDCDAFARIRIVCDEDVRWLRNAGQVHRGYVWRVVMEREDGIPVVEFHVDRRKSRPTIERFPPRVQQCVAALHALTQLPVDPQPEIRDAGAIEHGWFGRRMRMHSSRPMQRSANTLKIQVRDASGNVTDYDSVVDMPEDLRRLYERARQSPEGRVSRD